MEYIILIVCILGIILDYIKNKKIYSPVIVFNTIFFVTLGLYLFRFSYLQQILSEKTKLLFLVHIMAFNITSYLCSFIKFKTIKLPKLNLKLKKKKIPFEKKLAIARGIVILIFLIEVLYSGGFPLLWKITNSTKTYFDYGIPSVHGAFNGLVICLGAYTLFKKRKDKFLYLGIGILIISRQVLMSMMLEAIIFNFLSTKFEKKQIKKYLILGIIFVCMFNVIGNFRSGKDTMNHVFQPREGYEKMPDSLKWVYSYMTFSISNFNNLVSITDGNINHGASMALTLVPTVFLEIVHIEPKYNPNYLISPNYNTNTSFPEIYLDFGIYGIIGYGIFLALLGSFLFKRVSMSALEGIQLIYAVYIHNILLLFFSNMFLYLPVIIQIVYIIWLFGEKKDEKQ